MKYKLENFVISKGFPIISWLLELPNPMGVFKRRNRELQEMSRTMLVEQSVPQTFWYGEAVVFVGLLLIPGLSLFE